MFALEIVNILSIVETKHMGLNESIYFDNHFTFNIHISGKISKAFKTFACDLQLHVALVFVLYY